MSHKHTFECAECLNVFSLIARQVDAISYCPFCGELLPVNVAEMDEEARLLNDYADEDEDDATEDYE